MQAAKGCVQTNILSRGLENTKCSENSVVVLGQIVSHSRGHTQHGGAYVSPSHTPLAQVLKNGVSGLPPSSPAPVHLPENLPHCVTVL